MAEREVVVLVVVALVEGEWAAVGVAAEKQAVVEMVVVATAEEAMVVAALVVEVVAAQGTAEMVAENRTALRRQRTASCDHRHRLLQCMSPQTSRPHTRALGGRRAAPHDLPARRSTASDPSGCPRTSQPPTS